jgi:NAD(P)-dependent dehydrogenase (short-subunit alcohol dehydrogenase family)
MSRLDGRVAIVTGGAAGIGRATALALAAEGAAVVVADIDDRGARAAADEIARAGGRALPAACDVTRDEDCRRAVETAVDAFGRLDIVFNNAGIIRRADVVETSEEEWDRVMAVNLKSVFLMSRHAVPAMAATGGGSIVNTGSGWGLKGGGRAVSYCASKAAVVNMTRAMAIDHGPQNIRVNCVCPGDTDTGMLREEARQLGQAEERFLAEAADRPLDRLGRPADIANAVVFLVSDEAAWVTGTTLVVDGGGLA